MAAGQDVSLAAQGKVFTELLDHWGLAEPAVVAHDFGGCVALRTHLLHGVRYRALALVDAVALAPWGARPSSGSWATTPRCSSSCRPPCTGRWCGSTSARRASRGGSTRTSSTVWSSPGSVCWARRPSTVRSPRPTSGTPTRSRTGTTRSPCPHSCAGGDRTTPGSPWRRDENSPTVSPGARFEPLSGAGHLVQEDAPAALTAALIAFLG